MTPHAQTPATAMPRPAPAAAANAPTVTAGDMDIELLQRFKTLMAEDGQPVQVARMFSDRLYAYERIACAHASAHADLRRLALALFQSCHRADEIRKALS